MLGVKDSGRTPMAWGIRPGFRGDLLLCDGCCERFVSEDRVRNRNEPARRCAESCAVCSVACLEWVCGDGETSVLLVAKGNALLPRKPYLQKRLRVGQFCCGKHLGCISGRQGIAVRTQWQSGSRLGNRRKAGSKGNCPFGNGGFSPGKSNPT